MNKKSLLVTIFTTMLLTSLSIFAAQSYKVIVNGNMLNCKTIVQDDTTYVPLRAVTEALGAKVSVSNGVITITNAVQNNNDIEKQQVVPTQETPNGKDSGGIDPTKPIDNRYIIDDGKGNYKPNPNYNPQREVGTYNIMGD